MSKEFVGSKVIRQSCVESTLITEEPYDRIGHVRICGGIGWVTTDSTRNLTHKSSGVEFDLLASLKAVGVVDLSGF